jgi:hypothetical protein
MIFQFGAKYISTHLVLRRTKPDKTNPPSSFPFPVPNAEWVWKIMKMSLIEHAEQHIVRCDLTMPMLVLMVVVWVDGVDSSKTSHLCYHPICVLPTNRLKTDCTRGIN